MANKNINLKANPEIGTKTESECIKYFEAEGYEVYRPGWPDFLCVKGDQLILVEAKEVKDRLRPHQANTLQILNRFGVKTSIFKGGCLVDIFKVQAAIEAKIEPEHVEKIEQPPINCPHCARKLYDGLCLCGRMGDWTKNLSNHS